MATINPVSLEAYEGDDVLPSINGDLGDRRKNSPPCSSLTPSNSSSDSFLAVEMESMSPPRTMTRSRSTEIPDFSEFVPYLRDEKRTKYEEAALYCHEGANNEKFASHPNGVYSKTVFHIVHHPAFYISEFMVCCLLMALAIIEEPSWLMVAADNRPIMIVVHSVLEMILLSLIALSILLRFIWMKPKTFLYQRTSLAALIMIFMFIEAMVVLVRRENHFRVTRCLRPIFFIDSYIMFGVRRVLRQLFQCLKPILDVILLLLIMVAIFALAGYYLFADISPTYFDTYVKSFTSLFIALTTANHPDVYMEAYVRNRATPIFFVLYLFVTLFFFTNVLLGVLYAHFSEVDKEKFKKLYLHKREALRMAYYVLAKNRRGVDFHDFLLFMLEYNPGIPEYQVMCIFKALQFTTDPQNYLCLEEFLQFYEMQDLQWKQLKNDGEVYLWYENFQSKLKSVFQVIHRIERFRFFDHVMTIVVLVNGSFMIVFTIVTSYYCGNDDAGDAGGTSFKERLLQGCKDDRFVASRGSLIGSFIFNAIYLVEIVIRLLAVGPIEYFGKKWNCFDSFVIVTSIILLCIEAAAAPYYPILRYLVIFRPLKLIRIVKLKKRYYKILSSILYLTERLISVVLLIFILFYFFAIIGMEVFQGKVYVGCCENARFGVGQYYQSNETDFGANLYWLNNFDNIYNSYITLYEQMVVNNWFIQMEGFVSQTTIYARIYFMLFWLTSLLCLSVAVAYIVDAFVFSIQAVNTAKPGCKKHLMFKCKCNESGRKKTITVVLMTQELTQLKDELNCLEQIRNGRTNCMSCNDLIRSIRSAKFHRQTSDQIMFIGKGLRTKEYLNLQKHRSEIQEWINEKERQRKSMKDQKQQAKTFKTNVLNGLKAIARFILE